MKNTAGVTHPSTGSYPKNDVSPDSSLATSFMTDDPLLTSLPVVPEGADGP